VKILIDCGSPLLPEHSGMQIQIEQATAQLAVQSGFCCTSGNLQGMIYHAVAFVP
jgi:hypothetical protein